MDRSDGDERRVSRRTVLASTAAIASSTGMIGTVAADGDSALTDAWESNSGWYESARAGLSGAWDRATARWRGVDELTPTQAADRTQEVWNANATALVDYANDKLDRSARDLENYDVLRVTWIGDDGSEEDRYIVSTVDTSTSPERFTDTVIQSSVDVDQDVDHFVELDNLARDESADELEHFVETYVDEDKKIDEPYRRYLAGKYARDVNTDLIG